MKKFITNILVISIICIIVNILFIIFTQTFVKTNYDSKIKPEINKLIVGDSYTQTCLNDSILSNSINISDGGFHIMYSFIKIKSVIENNPNIDTVILGFSYKSLLLDQDMDRLKLGTNLEQIFFLLNYDEYLELFNYIPISLVHKTLSLPLYDLKNGLFRDVRFTGHFRYLTRDKLEYEKSLLPISHNKKVKNMESLIGLNVQFKYLKKIKYFCKENGITLILLHTPVYPLKESEQRREERMFSELMLDSLRDINFVDHSNLFFHDSCYSDLTHLNYKGAKIYSNYLNNFGF